MRKYIKQQIKNPYGELIEHMAIGEDWNISGKFTGSDPIYRQTLNGQYRAKASRWLNYLCYNQNRLINWSIDALDTVREHLHSTSVIILQNRLAIDTILAEDQGVCDILGNECGTMIAMHTGPIGNLDDRKNEVI